MTAPGRPLAETLAHGGGAAPPRANGELVFAAPWESRSFGIAVALTEQGTLAWDGFRARLIAEIGGWEASHGRDDAAWSYYEHWLDSLQGLLVEQGLLSAEEIGVRCAEIAERDAHEHGHGHGHGHEHGHADGPEHPQAAPEATAPDDPADPGTPPR